MKVNAITNPINGTHFKGTREDRNEVLQLTRDNSYSLNEPTQRRINQAIKNLAQLEGEENIQFLINVGQNLKYKPNLTYHEPVENPWSSLLRDAAMSSLSISDPNLKEKYGPEIEHTFLDPLDEPHLTDDEKDINRCYMSIVDSVKGDESEKKIRKDLSYFIMSTETTTAQKKYILERLNYFMSPEYHINPQLKDKKPQVLSEMVNDISINTQDTEIPNIKAINQKTHGMCAAISVVRKAIAYEDKVNYVDSILSELDDSDSVMVYDIQNLGSGKRIPVKKVEIDFDYAQEKGYRIVDASTLQWMNIGKMYGAQNENLYDYIPFDRENFDTLHDTFFTRNIPNPALRGKQSYYQSLTTAKRKLTETKTDRIKKGVKAEERRQAENSNLEMMSALNKELKSTVKQILPDASNETVQRVSRDLISLQQPYSDDIEKNRPEIKDFSYIPNEEDSQKKMKVEKYFQQTYSDKVNNEVLSDNSERLVSLVADLNELDSEINPTSSMRKKFWKGKELYEAEAAYRFTKVVGCADGDYVAEKLIEYDIPDRETRIVRGFDHVTNAIENKNNQTVLNHYANILDTTPDNREEILDVLRKSKESVEFLTTTVLDDFFNQMGLGSRREYIMSVIEDTKSRVAQGDEEAMVSSSYCMNVPKDKKDIIKEYERLEKRLENPEDEDAVDEAYNKMGVKDKTTFVIEMFNEYASRFSANNPDRDFYIQAFKELHGLPKNSTGEDVEQCLTELASDINLYAQTIQNAENLLDIPDGNDGTYFTVKEGPLLIKTEEEKGNLVSAKTMRKLQERFTKVDKIRSSDEFNSRQGKIANTSLYEFSPEEKEALAQIDKKLNHMHSDVTRELNKRSREIRTPLEQNAMYVGTNSGRHWIHDGIKGGLMLPQMIRVYERITDRPYYKEEDLKKSTEAIKSGIYSGVSCSSVFHNEIGLHAQYIADIQPDKNGERDILFHDNSWGHPEHENTWVDSKGDLRTDYSDNRGGDIGYVTDDKYRNGNYVDNLRHKVGHVSPDTTNSRLYRKLSPGTDYEYDFPLMEAVLLCGENGEYKDIAASLRDTIFIPDTSYIGTIQKHARKMTKEEIQKSIFRVQNAGTAYKEKYDKIMERVYGKGFDNGITTREEYDALPDDDIVKLAFEKTALRYAYEDSRIYRELPKAKTMKDIAKYKEKQRQEARENFNYAFGKTPEALYYPGTTHSAEMVNALTDALNSNGIEYTQDDIVKMVRNISAFEKAEKALCTGSVKDSIDFAVAKADMKFSESIPESEAADKAKEQYLSAFRQVLEDNMYFTSEDLKAKGSKAEGIRHWIDRKFDPQSDEEFVQIYRKLQDMTSDEFEALTEDVTDTELGISDESGYDLLVKVKAQSDNAESMVRNTLFYDEYSKDMSISKTKPAYKYEKNERKLRGVFYDGVRTFDDLYRTMYFACSSMELEKAFNKYKEMAFRNYGALPAYPKINIMTDERVDTNIESITGEIEEKTGAINVAKNCIFDIKLIHLLDKYRSQIPNDRPLTSIERGVISHLLGQYINYNAQDTDMAQNIENAYDALELKNGATIEDYNRFIDPISTEIRAIEKVNPIESFESSIQYNSMYIDSYVDGLTKREIPPRYRRRIKDDLKSVASSMRDNASSNGLDSNQEIISLLEKVEESSKDDKQFKQRLERFAALTTQIGKTKILKKSDDFDEEKYSEQLEKTNQYADRFVERFIAEDKRRNIRANIGDYINKELSNAGNRPDMNKVDDAIYKFREDFKKCHYNSNATMLLDTFLLESASDSGNAEDSKYVEYLEHYLSNQLEYAQLVETQSVLMEAADTGNPAQVKNYFEDYNVTSPYTGEVMNMNSDEGIDTMVKSLIVSDNTKTAKMLVEKLGIGDRFMRIQKDTMGKIDVKSKIDELGDILYKHNELSSIVTEECSDLVGKIDSAENVASEIYKTKRAISKRTKSLYVPGEKSELSDADKKKNSTLRKDIQFYFDALTDANKFIEENPGLSRTAILNQRISQALSDRAQAANERMEGPQFYINSIYEVYKFICNIDLPEYSEGAQIQKEIGQEFKALAEYNNTVIERATGKHSRLTVSKVDIKE